MAKEQSVGKETKEQRSKGTEEQRNRVAKEQSMKKGTEEQRSKALEKKQRNRVL